MKNESSVDLVGRILNANMTGKRELILAKTREIRYAPEVQDFSYNGQAGQNIVARAIDSEEKQTVVTAHYDGPGAYDNAGGVAVALSLMEKAGRNKRKDLTFVFTDLEEQGQLGARAFLEKSDVSQIKSNVNLDGAGIGDCLIEVDNGKIERLLPSVVGSNYYTKLQSDSDVFKANGIPSVHYATLSPREIEQFQQGQIPATWLRVLYNQDGIKGINEGDIQSAANKLYSILCQ